MMAKMKSVWAYGQEAPLGPTLAQPGAEEAAVGHAHLRLDGLVAGVERVGPRIAEADQRAGR